jgi:hypothetical protein
LAGEIIGSMEVLVINPVGYLRRKAFGRIEAKKVPRAVRAGATMKNAP